MIHLVKRRWVLAVLALALMAALAALVQPVFSSLGWAGWGAADRYPGPGQRGTRTAAAQVLVADPAHRVFRHLLPQARPAW